jgi:hypothetical protein
MKFRLVLSTLAMASASFAGIAANGTFGFNSTGGVITDSPSGSILFANSITLPVPNSSINCGTGSNVCEQITSIGPLYLGSINDFAPAGHTPLSVNDDVTFDSYTFGISPLTLPVFHFTVQNGLRFTFTASSAQKSTSSLAGSDFLNVAYIGTFSDSGAFYNPGAALLSMSYTQTGGASGAITYSGTFATPPPSTGSPEPATMAMLGSALIGLGVLGRKRFAR